MVRLPLLALAAGQNATARDIIEHLGLQPNVEKGNFREAFSDARTVDGNRPISTAIYCLLEGSVEIPYWHRVDAVEVCHAFRSSLLTAHNDVCENLIDIGRRYYAGAPLTLEMSWDNGIETKRVLLGGEIFDGLEPQGIVPACRWQRARSEGDWTSLGTTVAPEFVPDGF
ncbi:hypothetical protein E8E12_004741 [Didymella heteroderae]|uniref:DUF985 domain-containing protein n=1 Tax=Didymella heteroderae TaxID=1769908 RepID=A0A9P4WKR8_9PLEO|nr:hypothetical protein E8E12_004741 [Didymella heteroderae]